MPVDQKNNLNPNAEFRAPDPSANPYLAFPAIVAAGLDGIKIKVVQVVQYMKIFTKCPDSKRKKFRDKVSPTQSR